MIIFNEEDFTNYMCSMAKMYPDFRWFIATTLSYLYKLNIETVWVLISILTLKTKFSFVTIHFKGTMCWYGGYALMHYFTVSEIIEAINVHTFMAIM